MLSRPRTIALSILLSILLPILITLPSLAAAAEKGRGNTTNQSFNSAKKTLERQVYPDHRITFYCGCTFGADKQLHPCDNYQPKRENARSKRIEWEHVVPAHHFGQSFREWREGDPQCVDSKGKAFKGRNCASKIAIPYRYMESDLYNLVPAIGEVNGLRSNYRFGMVAGEQREFGPCNIEIEDQRAEPPEHVWGNIARTYKYMDWAYPGHGVIGGASRKLFDAWDKMDPVDPWECERARRIEGIQGNENPIVKAPCQAAGLWGTWEGGSAPEGRLDAPAPAIPGKTGEKTDPDGKAAADQGGGPYHGNTKSKVFHAPGSRYYNCKNCTAIFETREAAIAAGYKPCGTCNP